MPSDVPYTTAAEIRAQMDASSSDDDAQFTRLALAASRFIDGYTGRFADGFVAAEESSERVYPGSGKRWMWIDEAVEIEEISVKQSVTDPTFSKLLLSTDWRGFRGDPRSPNSLNFNKTPYQGIMLTASSSVVRWLEGTYWNGDYFYYNDPDSYAEQAFEPTISVTARWGYGDDIPPVIKEATIMQAIRLYKRQQGGMADALISGDFGQSRFLAEVDKDVKAMLQKSRLIRPNFGGR